MTHAAPDAAAHEVLHMPQMCDTQPVSDEPTSEHLTVQDVRNRWGATLDKIEFNPDAAGRERTPEPLTIYRHGHPFIIGLSPALYAEYQAVRRETDAAQPVAVEPAGSGPWRADFSNPNAPKHVAIDSRLAQRSWAEIVTCVARRGMHVTINRFGKPSAVMVPLDWPPQ